MGVAWFGIMDAAHADERPPSYDVEVTCTKCGVELIWSQPCTYDGPPPKHSCGGTVKRRARPTDPKP